MALKNVVGKKSLNICIDRFFSLEPSQAVALCRTDTFTKSQLKRCDSKDVVLVNHASGLIGLTVRDVLPKMDALFILMYDANIQACTISMAPEKLLYVMCVHLFHNARLKRQLMRHDPSQRGVSLVHRVRRRRCYSEDPRCSSITVSSAGATIELSDHLLKVIGRQDSFATEHFSISRTLIQALAGHESFARKDGRDDYHGIGRLNG